MKEKERITKNNKVSLSVAILEKLKIFPIKNHNSRRKNNRRSEPQSVYMFSGLMKNASAIKPIEKIARRKIPSPFVFFILFFLQPQRN